MDRSDCALFAHVAYGLTIVADVSIPGLPSIGSCERPDVRLLTAQRPRWVYDAFASPREPWPKNSDPQPPAVRQAWRIGEDCIHLIFPDGAEFVLNWRRAEIWAAWDPPLNVSDIAIYFVGVVLGLYAALLGRTALHASAVCLDDVAIALMGPGGSGKSTTATAFAVRGTPVICEDIAVLLPDGKDIRVMPGYPSVRLWPESARFLFGSEDALPPITPGWDKRELQIGNPEHPFAAEPKCLKAIYYLDERKNEASAPRIEAMSGSDAFVTVVSNTYANLLLSAEMRAAEFGIVAKLLTATPVRRVVAHTDPAYLDDLINLVAKDFRSLMRNRSRPREAALRAFEGGPSC